MSFPQMHPPFSTSELKGIIAKNIHIWGARLSSMVTEEPSALIAKNWIRLHKARVRFPTPEEECETTYMEGEELGKVIFQLEEGDEIDAVDGVVLQEDYLRQATEFICRVFRCKTWDYCHCLYIFTDPTDSAIVLITLAED